MVDAARAQYNEAEVLSDQGRLEEARPLFEEALRVWRASRYPAWRRTRDWRPWPRRCPRARSEERTSSSTRPPRRSARRVPTSSCTDRAPGVHSALVLEGRYAEARSSSPRRWRRSARSAPRDRSLSSSGSAGYALIQAREAGETARKHFEASLATARDVEAQYEIALTLRALADTRPRRTSDAARRESEELLEGLSVVSLGDAAPSLDTVTAIRTNRATAPRDEKRVGRGGQLLAHLGDPGRVQVMVARKAGRRP